MMSRAPQAIAELTTLDFHTACEPLRVITSGVPPIQGTTMLDKRRELARSHDALRQLLMHEPRGHAGMYGAVLTEPVKEGSDIGVLFMHQSGYSTMCGHAILALVHGALEHGLFPLRDEQCVRIDTPAGTIEAGGTRADSGKPGSAWFRNVPSFVLEPEYSVRVDGRAIDSTVAFGGAFYAYVDAEPLGLSLAANEAGELSQLGQAIQQAISTHYPIEHPEGDADINFLYGVIFVRQGADRLRSRNVCVFGAGQIDRSPTGTGVCGRAAIAWTRRQLELGETLQVESIIGTRFDVRAVSATTVGGLRAIVPEVHGSASLTGHHRFVLEAGDALPHGFAL